MTAAAIVKGQRSINLENPFSWTGICSIQVQNKNFKSSNFISVCFHGNQQLTDDKSKIKCFSVSSLVTVKPKSSEVRNINKSKFANY